MNRSKRMPVLFIGHGSPMNALEDNAYTRAWESLGQTLPRPKAILAISAHWLTNGTALTAMSKPKTIHDFGGFPQALFDMRYPAPGDPVLAARIAELLTPFTDAPVQLDHDWGLDHGSWSVLAKIYPDASIPVLQMSLDMTLSPHAHFALGQRLAVLRDEGVLIIASGNVVHNLRRLDMRSTGYDWAHRFNDAIREAILAGQFEQVIDYSAFGPDAALAVPTSEHFLPLLYVLGARIEAEPIQIFCDQIELGSISMLSLMLGEG
ncbi:4,5-DOPA dioxygenase extradiol [Undibacterium sp.]|uniref:4,5-DOPA-extradiol-dioxygenase n=1 Tax=Undibacterium sp. TaxID=1914977 RepID=UPI0025F3DD7F|nr:4,5-DOPA dioxygenase extradiol [Undibacterium sp.]MCX7220858.1 4,5-DOPA dioxygenase extradiol [Burkholderiales bacterium]